MRQDLRLTPPANYHPHGEAVIYPRSRPRCARTSTCGTRLSTARVNFGSVEADAPGGHAVHRSAPGKKSRKIFSPTSKRNRRLHSQLRPDSRRTRWSSRLAFPIFSSTAPAASPLAWPPTFLRHNLRENRGRRHSPDRKAGHPAERNHEDRPRPGLSHRRIHRGQGSASKPPIAPAAAASSCAPKPPSKKPPRTAKISSSPKSLIRSNKCKLIERIAELVQTKKIEGISDVRDESFPAKVCASSIELKRGEESRSSSTNLFKHTQMQESFGMILLSIVAGQPRELGLIPMIKLFIEHRMEVVRRRTSSSFAKAVRSRAHPGRLPDRPSITSTIVIRVIRGRRSRAEATETCSSISANKTSPSPKTARPKSSKA